MKFKRMSMFILAGLMMMILVGCPGCTIVPPGHVGIKVTYGGSDRGVSDFPTVMGWVFYIPMFQTVFEYPTFVQIAKWTNDSTTGRKGYNDEITFNTKEGMVVSGDVSLSYEIKPEKAPTFYVKFRSDRLEDFTHGLLRNIAMEQFSKVGSLYSIDDVNGSKKEEFTNEVKQRVNAQVAPYGVVIGQFGFIGDLRLPKEVKAALNLKIQATQDAIRVENEVRKEKAEAQKTIAKAEGAARSNQILNNSITPTLMDWERLQIQRKTIEKWNGQRPFYEGSGANLMFTQQGK